jgi:hypothetical protein
MTAPTSALESAHAAAIARWLTDARVDDPLWDEDAWSDADPDKALEAWMIILGDSHAGPGPIPDMRARDLFDDSDLRDMALAKMYRP